MLQLLDFFKKVFQNCSLGLTGRGITFVIFTIVLLLWPIYIHDDITATIIAPAFFTIIFLTICLTHLHARYLKKRLSLAIQTGSEFQKQAENIAEVIFSKRKATFVLKINSFKILSFYRLQITLNFYNENVEGNQIILKGIFPSKQKFAFELFFPHRGIWQIKSITLQLSDQLGLTKVLWTTENHLLKKTVSVMPAPIQATNLPILSSFYRTGDVITGSQERHGEHFDLKRYHPADGVKKIAWKIFARSGELMSRYPEQASSPEGQVALFSAARYLDDTTAAAALNYIKRLLDNDLEVVASCEGQAEQLATNLEDAKKLFINNVWDIEKHSISSEIYSFIDTVKKSQKNLELSSLLIFFSSSRLKDKSFYDDLIKIGSSLKTRNIEPIFCITKDPENMVIPLKNQTKAQTLIKNWFFTQTTGPAFSQEEFYTEFFKTALVNSWQTYSEDVVLCN